MTTLREFPQLPLGVHLDLVEHPGLDRLGRIAAAFDHAMIGPFAQIALGALGDVIGLGRHGLDRFLADDRVVAVEQHGAGRQQIAFGVDDRDRPAGVVQIGDDRIGRAQVDADGRDVFIALDGGGSAAHVPEFFFHGRRYKAVTIR